MISETSLSGTELRPALTERETLLHLKECFRLAAEDADNLAKGERGPIYLQFRRRLKEAERNCRELGVNHRADARWLPLGRKLAEAQQKCGEFLRAKQPGWRFAGLAQILRHGEYIADRIAHRATGRLGPILPIARDTGPLRQGRPVSMNGLILPHDFR